MKKFLYSIVALMLAVSPVAFTSCGDDEPDDPKDQPTKAEFNTTLAVSPEVVSFCNILATYVDPSGKTLKVTMPTTTETIDFGQGPKQMCVIKFSDVSSKIPANAEISYSIELNGYTPDAAKINVETYYNVTVKVLDGNGDIYSLQSSGAPFSSKGLDTKNLNSYINSFTSNIKPTKMAVDKKGYISIVKK